MLGQGSDFERGRYIWSSCGVVGVFACVWSRGASEVCRDFQGEISTAKELATTVAEKATAHTECRKRQREWIRRASDCKSGQGRALWRPPKRYRVSSYKNLISLDHQLNTVGLSGLSHFKRPDWSVVPWHEYPMGTICWDQESSNLTCAHWLWHEKACIDFQWDASHGAWNDVKAMARDSNYFGFLLGLLLVWNLPHGPWADDLRSSQVKEALAHLQSEPDVPPIIAASSFAILKESGQEGCLADQDGVESLWQEFRSTTPFDKKGSKTSLNRFMSLVAVGQQEFRFWSFRRAAYELVALESDMLGSKKFETLMVDRAQGVAAASSAGADGPETVTSSRRPDCVDAAVRKSCENALVISCYVLSTPYAHRRLGMFLEIAGHAERWHIKQSRVLRSVQGSLNWTCDESGGGCMANISSIWSSVVLPASLSRQGFWLPNGDRPAPSPEIVSMEDCLASESATMCLSLIRHRLLRTLPLTMGWPSCASRLLSAELAGAESRRLMASHAAFLRLQAASGEHHKLTAICDRSLFERPCVEVLVKALTETKGVVTSTLKSFLTNHFSRITSTMVCEDGFNSMMNDKDIRRRRLTRPERSMAVVVCKEVLSTKHKYQEVDRAVPLCKKGVEVPRCFFHVDTSSPSMPFKEIIGARPSVAYFSPSAERSTMPIADLALYEYGLKNGYDALAYCWLGGLTKVDHHLMIREAGPPALQWHFALGPVGDSSVLLWPATQKFKQFGDTSLVYFEPVVLKEPVMQALCCLQEWEACLVEHRSPAWAVATHPDVKLPKRILAIQKGPVDTLLKIAARSAFWSLDLAFLQGLATHLDCAIAARAVDTFAAVTSLVSFVLPDLSEQEICNICCQRTVSLARKACGEGIAEILQLEEAGDFLDKDDHKCLKREGEKRQSKKVELQEFQSQICKKRQSCGTSSASGSASGGSGLLRVPKVGEIPQPLAKQLCPPRAFIWRSLGDGAWVGRLPPHGEISRSWARHGERSACMQVLQTLWSQYCDVHGLLLKNIPVQGLWDGSGLDTAKAPVPIIAEGSSSSSSAVPVAGVAKAAAKAKPRARGPSARGKAKAKAAL